MHFIYNSHLTLISYTFQLRQHSACPSCALIITANNVNNWYFALAVYCILTLIPAEYLTERTSDNQLWITLVRNDIPQFAIYQIVTFFVGNKNAVKIDNLIVWHWLNILCKRDSVKWCNCYQRATLTSRSCFCACIYGSLLTKKTGQRIVIT